MRLRDNPQAISRQLHMILHRQLERRRRHAPKYVWGPCMVINILRCFPHTPDDYTLLTSYTLLVSYTHSDWPFCEAGSFSLPIPGGLHAARSVIGSLLNLSPPSAELYYYRKGGCGDVPCPGTGCQPWQLLSRGTMTMTPPGIKRCCR